MDKFTEMKNHVAALEADADAFYNKGNKSAGTRLRVGLQKLKVMAQDLRVSVSEAKNA